MDWRVEALRRGLDPLLPGLRVEVVAQTISTNTDLLERARAAGHHDLEPCLLIAEQQSGGRGRLGRRWHSTPGASLTFSLALPLAPGPGLSLAVGVALADALEPPRAAHTARDTAAVHAADALRIGLKWPNDLWLADRKLGGILIETVSMGAARQTVIGIGLNIRPLDEPAAAASNRAAAMTSGYAWLQELEAQAEAPAVLRRIAPALLRALRVFERDGFAAFHARYTARDLLRGHAVTTTQPGAAEGIAQGVGDDGCLLLQSGCGMLRSIASGEVSVRPAGPAAARATVA